MHEKHVFVKDHNLQIEALVEYMFYRTMLGGGGSWCMIAPPTSEIYRSKIVFLMPLFLL